MEDGKILIESVNRALPVLRFTVHTGLKKTLYAFLHHFHYLNSVTFSMLYFNPAILLHRRIAGLNATRKILLNLSSENDVGMRGVL